MRLVPTANLACPLDGAALAMRDKALACPHGHGFDRARAGYVNLLANQHKTSADPGDSREMVAARRAVLDGGVYAPLAAKLTTLAGGLLGDGRVTIVDAGCGEGYYTDHLARALQTDARPGEISVTGLDISKWAVQTAAKRSRAVGWIVANNRYPPFLPDSVGMLLCLFGFPAYEAFARIQPTGACLIMANPGPDHLIELRRTIYPSVERASPLALTAAEAAGYRLAGEHAVTYGINLSSNAQIKNLLMMTPHYFRMPRAGREALMQLEGIDVTVDVRFRVLQLV